MPAVQQYAVAWIATNSMIWRGAYRMLGLNATSSAWQVETPRDLQLDAPTEYRYVTKEVNGHNVYLADAVDENNVTELAQIMVNKLQSQRIHVRMFLVSTDAFLEDYCLDFPLTTNYCLFDTFPIGDGRVSVESERNGRRLLTAAEAYQGTQIRENYQYRAWFLYNYQDPGLALNMGRSFDFFGLPAMAFFGLCSRSDFSETAQTNAGAVAGTQIMGVLEHMETLECVVRR